ncbi:MAG: DNA gyrase subunit A [Erysipelotrichales bacterium]|nr:DNA gyrase subunit A [Erysipelotrichales bacterium]
MEDNKELDITIHGKIDNVEISKEMRESFLEYSMSVIVARALPDVRDGMKPVHRRILYAMNDLGMYADKPHKKSARIVGEVIGKYHPHGDVAVYETMVRMAQDFSYRYPLVDGHGNFGSIDGDQQAAMRYTEARMSKISMELMRDLNKDTVNFVDNYDGEEKEPEVLPARFPNLLVNGTMGIAVGMATNMPPHNLGECIDAIRALMDNPDISITELMNYIKGPDFPTGAYILGRSGIRKAYETGRGSVIMRSKCDIVTMDNGKKQIIVREIPYQVNKAVMVEKIANLVREKVIEGITDLRDESNREGIKVVIELRKDVQAEVLLNQLYRLTSLQSSFGINFLALVNGVPKLLNIKQIIQHYIDHQVDVIVRRTKYELRKAEERSHILKGLLTAIDNIDEIINIIRSSKDDPESIARMHDRFDLDEIQGKAILDMQFRRLTGLQRNKLQDEFNELAIAIADFKDILSNSERVNNIIYNELKDIAVKHGDERRTEIIESDYDVEDEDLIPVEDIVVSLTANGYIKRISLDTYHTQNRGGKGIKGMNTHDDDAVSELLTMSTHDWLLIFTNTGKVYRMKGYKVPSSSRNSKGLPIINLCKLEKDEKVMSMIRMDANEESGKFLFFATKQGLVKRTPISEFEAIRQSGKIAITLRDDDELVGVKLSSGDDEIILAASNGKVVRFNENDVRPMGRTASGVKGMNVDGSHLVGLANASEGKYILSISENGYGKKTELSDYRLTSRGAKGVKSIAVTEKNGPLVTIRTVNGDEDLMLMTSIGIFIRISLSQVGEYSRNTQGVKLVSVNEGVSVVACAVVDHQEDEETSVESNENIDNNEN